MKKFIKILNCCLLIALCFFCMSQVNAKEDDMFNINDIDLYNETNKYDYHGLQEKNSERYYMDKRNDNIVSEKEPLITVLTHGLNGNASHWSNKSGSFCYVKDSLIDRLSSICDCNVYVVKVTDFKQLEIYDFTEIHNQARSTQINLRYDTNNKSIKKDHITDISKHSIVIFEATRDAKNGTNDEVYTEFNYAISRIVYDVKKLNNDVLPKINLIGHSRGGITNMQYALDHPDLVDSIYSL